MLEEGREIGVTPDLLLSHLFEAHAPLFETAGRDLATLQLDQTEVTRIPRDAGIGLVYGLGLALQHLDEAPLGIEQHARDAVACVVACRAVENRLEFGGLVLLAGRAHVDDMDQWHGILQAGCDDGGPGSGQSEYRVDHAVYA